MFEIILCKRLALFLYNSKLGPIYRIKVKSPANINSSLFAISIAARYRKTPFPNFRLFI